MAQVMSSVQIDVEVFDKAEKPANFEPPTVVTKTKVDKKDSEEELNAKTNAVKMEEEFD